MKRILILFLLLLAGCMSTDKTAYQHVTREDIRAKIQQNNASKTDAWHLWRYAGSDDSFDYVYEYDPGIFLAPDSGFMYYKLDRGQVQLPPRTEFKPDKKMNVQIFEN